MYMTLQDKNLYNASRIGNLSEAVAAIERGADINWMNNDEVPIMLSASWP